jgi:hypothetical protein
LALASGALNALSALQGITYKIAEEQGIATAQLPIGEYLHMATRKVLTVNHGTSPALDAYHYNCETDAQRCVGAVFEILLKFKLNNDWETTLLEVLPKRKGAQSRVSGESADNSAGEDEQDEQEDEESAPAAPSDDAADAQPATTSTPSSSGALTRQNTTASDQQP